MEALKSPLILSRAISQAVNEMHAAGATSTAKLLSALKEAQNVAGFKPLKPDNTINLEMIQKAYRCVQ